MSLRNTSNFQNDWQAEFSKNVKNLVNINKIYSDFVRSAKLNAKALVQDLYSQDSRVR